MSVDAHTFRTAMRRLAAGVCVITTSDGDARWGATATAVCSVSAEPPILLCCLNRSSSTHNAISKSGVFAVNVLALEDQAIAARFAASLPPDEKFAVGAWTAGRTSAPLLRSALVSFDCRVLQALDIGTHSAFFGEIVDVAGMDEEARALLYASGAYGAFAVSAAARA